MLGNESRVQAEGVPGFVTSGVFVDPETPPGTPIAAGPHLDDVACQLGDVAANVKRLVELSQSALEHAAKLSAALAEMETLQISPRVSWASEAERARLAELRAVLDRALGRDPESIASPIPVFPRDVPAKYQAVDFMLDHGMTVEEAHAAAGLSEGATRKFWCDYTSRDDDDFTGMSCSFCAGEPCVCSTVTNPRRA